jgi:HK97 family phage portal protein
MGFFGIRKKAAQNLSPVDSRGGWWPIIRESYAGAWQKNEEIGVGTAYSYHAVFACITLISADIGKLRVKLVQQDPATGIWSETTSPSFSPVLRKPNRYQNHIQFKEQWFLSKLSRGNAYALKQRDNRGIVTALYVLDPTRVTPLVSPDGSIFYELQRDNLSGLESDQGVTVPSSEIIHDRMNCLFHPLVGISPLYASGLAASQGIKIQNNSSKFFANGSRPGGVLTAPGSISDETAKRLKAYWDAEYAGDNVGKTAVLGDGLKYEAMAVTAVDAQLVEQLKWTAEVVCSTFHVPAFKVGVGTMPTYQNAQILNQIYYSDCLQSLIESFEACMDEGLGLDTPVNGRQLGTELDIDALLRMDSATLSEVEGNLVKNAVKSPNEARLRFDLPPVEGGDSPMMQQQNWSLAQLHDRSAIPDAASVDAPELPTPDETDKALARLWRKSPESLTHA